MEFNIKLQALVMAMDYYILLDETEYRGEAQIITDKMRSYIRARVLKMEDNLTEEQMDQICDLATEITNKLKQYEAVSS